MQQSACTKWAVEAEVAFQLRRWAMDDGAIVCRQ